MAKLKVTGTLATTRLLDKYGGVEIPLETLKRLRDQLDGTSMPMHMNHNVLNAIDATILDVRIEQIADDEHGLLVDFEVDEDTWATVEDEWKAAGVPGGFSAALTQRQEKVGSPSAHPVMLISDAGTYSDEDRTEAARLISGVASVEVFRLFQFSESEFAKIVLEFSREVGAGGLVAAVSYLVGRNKGKSHIEMKRAEADGSVTTAVIDTDDPEIVRLAAESLDSSNAPAAQAILIYDAETESWKPAQRS